MRVCIVGGTPCTWSKEMHKGILPTGGRTFSPVKNTNLAVEPCWRYRKRDCPNRLHRTTSGHSCGATTSTSFKFFLNQSLQNHLSVSSSKPGQKSTKEMRPPRRKQEPLFGEGQGRLLFEPPC
mmetsp:Transcript_6733/g.12238  ORF Transcript_6733/g.12238 Transcript_6733/m.12238 type:complete len:123 (-) Transcript_6733:220-588(-)